MLYSAGSSVKKSAFCFIWIHNETCCVDMCGILFVVYGGSVFSSVLCFTERIGMGLYDVNMCMSLLCMVVVSSPVFYASLRESGWVCMM